MEDQELKELLKQLIVSVQALTFAVNAIAWKQQVITVPAPQPTILPWPPTTQPIWISQPTYNGTGNTQQDGNKALAFNLQN